MNNYEKYIKYKKKYIELKETQQLNKYGGNNKLCEIYTRGKLIGIDMNFISTRLYKKLFGEYCYIDETNNIVYANFGSEAIDKNCTFNNIDKNIFVLKTKECVLDNTILSEYFDNYLTNEIKNLPNYTEPNNNLFITIAPVTLKDYYFPLFFDEYLSENPNEKLTIIIIGKNYDETSGGFDLDFTKVNNYFGEIKKKFANRIYVIHVYINFQFLITNHSYGLDIPKCFNKPFLDFLLTNTFVGKLNILYIGFNSCGYVKNFFGIGITNFILIGCDCIKYKNKTILLPEQEYHKIVEHSSLKSINFDTIVNSNQINYKMISDILNNN